ncbi:DNA (cytosine-5-)-methyltransferase [Capilliphycus salinus ALCB114379]|uniref:DNA (cytosine-5-)-methyltransferase n=1 Tax=Capilliphycus salinus TaxID=2768948 RepID=UPI0039A6063F
MLKFVDLFAGIGGLRLGFEQGIKSLGLRGECLLASEIDVEASQVYSQNFLHVPQGDIRQINSLPKHDILLAGFPCQSFSYAGKKQGFGEIRGTLFFEIMRLIDTQKPKVLILENVRGLTTHDSGKTFATIEHEIQLRGYSFYKFLLNSVNFGLPQNRVRVYLVGVLNASPQFNLISDLGPKDSHAYNAVQLNLFSLQHFPPKVKDILEENPDTSFDCSPEFVNALNKVVGGDFNKLHGVRLIDYRGGNSIHSWELGLRGKCGEDEVKLMNLLITERRKKKFGQHQDGKQLTFEQIYSFYPHSKLTQILESLVNKQYLKHLNGRYKPVSGNFSFEVYKFLDPEKISVTLVASDANRIGIYHNNRVRRITPREAARLQGFPDTFKLHPNPSKAFYQLGNSVSINVISAITQEVIGKVFHKNYPEFTPEKKNSNRASFVVGL